MVGVAVRHFTAGLARVVSWLCTDTELTILPELLFLYFCFAEQMAEAWSLALEAAKVPEAARQKLIQLGYETQDAFNFDDDDTFKAFMKQFLLVEWKPDGVTEQTWFFHPIVGKLKAVWKKAAGCTHPPSQVLPAPSPATGGLAGALVGHSKTLTVVNRDEMRRDLEKKYTGVLVTLASLPSMSLLHTVKAGIGFLGNGC